MDSQEKCFYLKKEKKVFKIQSKDIFIISLVAYIINGITNYLSCLNFKNLILPSYIIEYDFFAYFLSFILILIIFVPIQIIIKYKYLSMKSYITLSLLTLQITIFLNNYSLIDERNHFGSTLEWYVVPSYTLYYSILGIIISSALFFIFLKWYLKPNNEEEV